MNLLGEVLVMVRIEGFVDTGMRKGSHHLEVLKSDVSMTTDGLQDLLPRLK